MRVLLVDDDGDLLDMTARRLTKRGLQVTAVSTLTEARDIYRAEPDLPAVVCDLFLSDGENGINFFEELESLGFSRQFVLVTGDDTGDARIEIYREAKAKFTCLAKPYAIDELIAVLRRL